MVAVIQRVDSAAVYAEGKEAGRIGKGLLVLLGVYAEDEERDASLLAAKIAKLRVFSDDAGKQNLSLRDVGGEVLLVSNFTLCANYRHGNRPEYLAAARPEKALPLYRFLAGELEVQLQKKTKTGVFGAHMSVETVCNGPITLVIDSEILKKNGK